MSHSSTTLFEIHNADKVSNTTCHTNHLLDHTSFIPSLPTFENTVLALSCPYRSFILSGEKNSLFQFGYVKEKEQQMLKKILKRYFSIVDEVTLRHYINSVKLIISQLEAKNIFFQDLRVYMSSQVLFVISSSIDVGYVSFVNYISVCEEYVGSILSLPYVSNWSEFALAFMNGNLLNTSKFVRRRLERNITNLLKSNLSPWSMFDWNCIRSLMLSKES